MLKTAYNNGFLAGLKRFKVSNALPGYGSSAPTAPPIPTSTMAAVPAQASGRAPSPAAPIAPQGHRSMVL